MTEIPEITYKEQRQFWLTGSRFSLGWVGSIGACSDDKVGKSKAVPFISYGGLERARVSEKGIGAGREKGFREGGKHRESQREQDPIMQDPDIPFKSTAHELTPFHLPTFTNSQLDLFQLETKGFKNSWTFGVCLRNGFVAVKRHTWDYSNS